MYAGRIVEIGADRGAVQCDAPPVHAGAARLDPAAGAGQHQAAAQHSRAAAGPHEPAGRLPFRRALPVCDRAAAWSRSRRSTGSADHMFSCWNPVDGPAELTETIAYAARRPAQSRPSQKRARADRHRSPSPRPPKLRTAPGRCWRSSTLCASTRSPPAPAAPGQLCEGRLRPDADVTQVSRSGLSVSPDAARPRSAS